MRRSTAGDRERMIDFPAPLRRSQARSAFQRHRSLRLQEFRPAQRCPLRSPTIRCPCTRCSTPISGRACWLKKFSSGSPPCSSPSAAWTAFPTPSQRASSSVIRYGAVVTRIRQSDPPASPSPTTTAPAPPQTIDADYCICAMPLTIARTLDADFSSRTSARSSTAPRTTPPTKSRGRRRASGRRSRTSSAASLICNRPSIWSGIPARASFLKRALSSAATTWRT